MVVDLDTKYTTAFGGKVKLYEIIGKFAIGIYIDKRNSEHVHPAKWEVATGKYFNLEDIDMSQFDLIADDNFEISYSDKIKVEYFGHVLYINPSLKYLATDNDGQIWGYNIKPDIGTFSWVVDWGENEEYLGDIEFSGNWKNSLWEIN